jgi:hypothetical protein
MNNGRRTIMACVVAATLVGLTFGCGDVQKREKQKTALSGLAETSGGNKHGDSSVTGGPAAPAYTISGNRGQPGVLGVDGKVSLLASVSGDLNEDGRKDKVVILVLDSVGSGVFYHLNVFLDDGKGGWRFVGEDFLGDRIKFDFLDIYAEGSVSSITGVSIHPNDYGQIVVAYSVRASEQSFTEEPNLYLAKHWKVEGGKLVLIESY